MREMKTFETTGVCKTCLVKASQGSQDVFLRVSPAFQSSGLVELLRARWPWQRSDIKTDQSDGKETTKKVRHESRRSQVRIKRRISIVKGQTNCSRHFVPGKVTELNAAARSFLTV